MFKPLFNAIESVIAPKKIDPALPDWEYLWANCTLDKERARELTNVKGKILANLPRYEAVSKETGVNAYLIAALHYRETSLRFDRCLHNGEKLPGPTTLVPKGRGPFSSWEESAIDALRLVGLHRTRPQWPVDCLISSELFNGRGYRRRGILSPYVWAGTNWSDEKGKFVADGKFDRWATEKQLGVAAILMAIEAEDY